MSTDKPTLGDCGAVIDSTADVLDTRDVCERIGALAANRGTLTADERQEFRGLRTFAREFQGTMGYTLAEAEGNDSALIRESYFAEYARELAEDIGAIDPDAAWPLGYIDWDRAADELRMDYTAVRFAGVTYWTRS